MRALDIKVLRDLAQLRGQLIAIALVIACGVGVYLGMRSTMRSLEAARASYYAHERFGHVFASLERAPESVASTLAAIPGVEAVETRVVAEVTLDVPRMAEAVSGRLVSIPDRGRPAVNDLRLRSGRLPAPRRSDEVIANEAFFAAHDLELGARIGAVINGRHEELTVVGTCLSPEFTYAIGPSSIFPDDRRYGILWMRREPLAAAFDVDGAFNDVSLRVSTDALLGEIIQRVDARLDRYGGIGAIARRDQASAWFLSNELAQLRTFAVLVPTIFLIVAAFLLSIVVGRIVAGQREKIAILKAFGYRDREVGFHYAKLVSAVVLVGCVLGVLLAASVGAAMTRQYAEYFRFPELPFVLGVRETIEGVALSVVAAAGGAWGAVRSSVVLPPAEAMRPPAPPSYRPTIVERAGFGESLPVTLRSVLRELERRPRRTIFAVLGVAMATALTIMNAFFFDALQHMLNIEFGVQRREDVSLTLSSPRSVDAISSIEELPGVQHAEPYRTVPVRFRRGTQTRNGAIIGTPSDSELTTLLDTNRQPVAIPPSGLVMARRLAQVLGVEAGDSVRVEVLEGARLRRDVHVARIAETYVGTTTHMNLRALSRLLGETRSLSGAHLLIDEAELPALHATIKETPLLSGVASRSSVLQLAQKLIREHLGTYVATSLGFSLVMALGVLYNTIRIALSERARELASLRVLGYRRGEVAALLVGEIAVVLAFAIPLGLLGGRGLAALLVASPGFDSEQFRLPLVIDSRTYALAVLTVLVAAGISVWIARRKLDQMDIVDVLKARD